MPEPGLALAELLLEEAIPHSACCRRRSLALFSLFTALGVAVLLSAHPYGRREGSPDLAAQGAPIIMQSLPSMIGKQQQRQQIPGREQFFQFDTGQRAMKGGDGSGRLFGPFQSQERSEPHYAGHPSRNHPAMQSPEVHRMVNADVEPLRNVIRSSGVPRAPTAVRAAVPVIDIPEEYKTITPNGEWVLLKLVSSDETESGSVITPYITTMMNRIGEVVAVGPGMPPLKNMTVEPGDVVLYSAYRKGVTHLNFQDADHVLIREADITGTMPDKSIDFANVPKMSLLGDRVMIKVEEKPKPSVSSLLLPGADPMSTTFVGEIVRVGPGLPDPKNPGQCKTDFAEGDEVIYFEAAGEPVETPDGSKYLVLTCKDIFAKVAKG